MKTVSPLIFFLVLSPEITKLAGAQAPGGPSNPDYTDYTAFTPSVAMIIVVLMAALFLIGFFSIYVRHCSQSSSDEGGGTHRALSTRRRARGLDASVMETFPTFTYSEVKHHKIGKGALECSVCLNEFEDEETLKLIPKCDHVFHPECIDVWLQSHVTCPVCRAVLVPNPGDDPIRFPNLVNVNANEEQLGNDVVDRNGSRNEEVRVEVDVNDRQHQEPNRPQRSWSVKKFAGVGKFSFKFKSHSTGHSLVQPVENLERFTLRLPEQVRKEVMDRATLNRTRSCAATLPRERSTRRGYRGGGGEGRLYSRINQQHMSEPEDKSDKWVFLTRAFSMKLPKAGSETGQGSAGKGTPVRMTSFKCLEPKAVDEMGLFPDSRSGKSPV
ncbi:hypothetical protein ACJIZ3_020009 [Penstemon smallii]|uniref:RING-type E3 ubiquitin transferase n=1 Tax=Penstemon smallii TaxID=265156 RepID=A0ABD3SHP1_9LAMI